MGNLHIFDMDGTLLTGTTASLEVARRNGTSTQLADLESRFATADLDTRGFSAALHRLWRDLTPALVATAYRSAPWLTRIADVCADIRRRGEHSAVITMSPDFFARHLLDLGFDDVIASRFPTPPFTAISRTRTPISDHLVTLGDMGPLSPHLPPGGHLISTPTPPGPRPLRAAARSATLLTLLALTAAVAVWAVIQLAQRAPTGSSPRSAGQTTSGAAHTTTGHTSTSGPATRTPATPGAATQHDGHHGGVARTRDAPPHAGTPPGRTPRRTVGPRKARQPARPPRPPSAGAPSWIRAECARRYPDAAPASNTCSKSSAPEPPPGPVRLSACTSVSAPPGWTSC